MEKTTATVSIVMPVYNAAAFLETGINSIREQTFTDWELIAVDDGSTDNSREIIESLTGEIEQNVIYHRQENKGGFGARNTGLDLANGKYIAFFDCDDSWYPLHLQRCVEMLETVPEVDWVFAANKIVDLTNNTTLSESNFQEPNGTPRPLLKLQYRKVGDLHLIDDPDAARCQILHGLNVGQQFSVIRREVFENYRFRSSYRNEGADQVSVIRSLSRGFTFGYLNEVHGVYCVHDNNASAGAKGASVEKYMRLRRALIRGFEELREEETLTSSESRAIDRRIAKELFWDIGYNILWTHGQRSQAIKEYFAGLKRWPWDLRMWKTFTAALVKSAFARG